MLSGIHHVTAIAGDARQNLDFYTRVLGMRLVKRTVNYDDPATYHFYFGDQRGQPGSLLTFFPWGHLRTPRKGAGQVVAVRFATPSHTGPNPKVIEDPDGLRLELHEGVGLPRLIGVTILTRDAAQSAATLESVMGLRRETPTRFVLPDGGTIELQEEPTAELGTMGRGIVHHVAFRVESDDIEVEWRQKLMTAGLRVSNVKDRTYFHSIYSRPHGSPLFEIATDGPGFTIDEPAESLGESLALPHWLEPHRESIVARLPSLV
jgi:glyoxalase family protein